MLKDNLEYCPNCNSNLQGKEIPKEHRENYGATHFSRKIGRTDVISDRTVEFMCPDCKHMWDVE